MSGTKTPAKKGAAPRKGGGGGGQPQAVPRRHAGEGGSGVANPAAAPSDMPRLLRHYRDEVRG